MRPKNEFQHLLHFAAYKAACIVNYCCALHNIRLHFNSHAKINDSYLVATGNAYPNEGDNAEANRIRDSLKIFFFNIGSYVC